MEISGVGSVYTSASGCQKTKTAKSEEAVVEKKPSVTDSFVKTEKADERVADGKRLSSDQIDELRAQHQANFDKLISEMMGKQAQHSKKATSVFDNLPKLATTQEEAQAAIAADGDWGVNAVATRIMDMAVGLSGGDASKISLLRGAVEKGFENATKAWGGELPSICNDTYEEISKRFDYWESNGSLDGYTME
ncbi:MAG: hypothetical protein PHY44_00980 [Lachnospiraceae bacterium]|nr:hypothetical protein [Lachnospiraceae bacterium]